jgi:hypothetical protein
MRNRQRRTRDNTKSNSTQMAQENQPAEGGKPSQVRKNGPTSVLQMRRRFGNQDVAEGEPEQQGDDPMIDRAIQVGLTGTMATDPSHNYRLTPTQRALMSGR